MKKIKNYDFIDRDKFDFKEKILGGIIKKGYSKEQLSNWIGYKNKIINIIDEVLDVTIYNSQNSYDYFKNIRKITRNLRNGSCNFFPPYGLNFIILFPFGLEIRRKGKEEKLIIITHNMKEITNFYIERMKGKDIRNMRVRRLWMGELEEIEGEDGVETLKRWRDENIKRSSLFGELDGKEEEGEDKEKGRGSAGGEGNEKEEKRKEREKIEIEYFSTRNLRWSDIPKGGVKMECEDEEGKIENNTIPFFGALGEDTNSSSLYPMSNPLSFDPFDDDDYKDYSDISNCYNRYYMFKRRGYPSASHMEMKCLYMGFDRLGKNEKYFSDA